MLIEFALLSVLFDASAYAVPAVNWDPATATDMLEALFKKGVAVQRAAEPFDANGKHYPAGTFVIPANPDLDRLSVEMGVPVEPLDRPVGVPLTRVTQFHAEGAFTGHGRITTLDHRDNSAFIATAFLLDRYEGVSWSANGTIVLDSWYADGFARAENFSKQFVVRVTLTDDPNLKPLYELKRPRLALYRAAGWLTGLLDEATVPYQSIEALDAHFESVIVTGSPDSRFDAFLRAGGTLIVLPEPIAAVQRISIDGTSPIAFGMPTEIRVMAAPSEPSAAAHSIAKFSTGTPALTEETVGKGHLIRFFFRPQPGTAKLLLNAIYLASARRL